LELEGSAPPIAAYDCPMDAPDPVGQGWMALLAGAWQKARVAFEEALKHGETPEALDGLAGAAGWLDDAETALPARERDYRLFRQRGEQEVAARVAFNLAIDVLNFRGNPAVAQGWLERGRDLLRDHPDSPWLGAIDVVESLTALTTDNRPSLDTEGSLHRRAIPAAPPVKRSYGSASNEPTSAAGHDHHARRVVTEAELELSDGRMLHVYDTSDGTDARLAVFLAPLHAERVRATRALCGLEP
jgi:hypothetical protein